MGKWDYNQFEEEFRLDVAYAFGEGMDPLNVLGRDWGGSRD